jgi:hypothetical protein
MQTRLYLMCALLFTLTFQATLAGAIADSTALAGRWDLTIDIDGKQKPSWLEVRHSGFNTWVGQFVAVVGSSRPISKVNYHGSEFSFSIPPQWEQGTNDLTVEGKIDNEMLSGRITFPDGKNYSFSGKRAPALRKSPSGKMDKPVSLIQANGLKGWQAMGSENQWVVENGILKSAKSGVNLVTEQKFNDFKMHVEFRYPEGSNSGVYLRGRYEVQITDSKGKEPSFGELGGVYGFIAPSEQAAKDAGEWQSFDITLTGRMLTLVINGKPVITNQEIAGITGGALDSNEGEPGPILLQGDHGPIEFRNMIITPFQ